MIFCLNRSNEYFRQLISSHDNFQILKRLKLGKAKHFCQIGPNSEFLEEFLEEAYSYGFEEKPNYSKLKLMIEKMLMDEDVVPNKQYSWVWDNNAASEEQKNEEISSDGGY